MDATLLVTLDSLKPPGCRVWNTPLGSYFAATFFMESMLSAAGPVRRQWALCLVGIAASSLAATIFTDPRTSSGPGDEARHTLRAQCAQDTRSFSSESQVAIRAEAGGMHLLQIFIVYIKSLSMLSFLTVSRYAARLPRAWSSSAALSNTKTTSNMALFSLIVSIPSTLPPFCAPCSNRTVGKLWKIE